VIRTILAASFTWFVAGCALTESKAPRAKPKPEIVLGTPAEFAVPSKPMPLANPIVQTAFQQPVEREVLPPPRQSANLEVLPAPSIRGGTASIGGPLGLLEILDATEQHYPLLRAIEQERAIAGGRLVSAMGVFDFQLNSAADGQGPGTYPNFRSSAGFLQNLPVGGIGVFGGYRNGYGDFPSYNLGQKTADGGEFRAGFIAPLLKDRSIDRPRATIQQAQIDVQLAEPVIERQRLDFQRAAALTYWNWVSSGKRLQLVEGLLDLAVDRDDQLKKRVEIGPTANIERIDNQQNIAMRSAALVQAQRAFQQAAIDLSLFHRNESGQPLLNSIERLPPFPDVVPADAASFDSDLAYAFEQRPEPRRLRLQREKAAVELALASNQTLPTLNAALMGSQDVGPGKSTLSGPNGLDRSGLNAGLTFQLPLQRREARGRMALAQSQMIQIEQQLRFAEDIVRADVQDAYSALDRAFEFHKQADKRVELARTVARAEREQLKLGRSDILRVTLREQAAFDAEIIEINAMQEYFRAKAQYRAAIGAGGR